MSVYAGDVHRKRCQVAVIDASGKVLTNRYVPQRAEPIVTVIGGLPPGTPAAFGAAHGTSWLAGCRRITGLPRTWCTHRGARRSPRPG